MRVALPLICCVQSWTFDVGRWMFERLRELFPLFVHVYLRINKLAQLRFNEIMLGNCR